MEAKTLQEKLDSHLLWFDTREGTKANFSGAILRDAILENVFLKYAILEGTILAGANLMDANLEGAALDGADLRGAFLQIANLSGAQIKKALLADADLRGANLHWANLSESFLEKANFHKADLSWANLKKAVLYGASFEEANLAGAHLVGANLKRANIKGANLNGTNFMEACLEGANLEGVSLRETVGNEREIFSRVLNYFHVVWCGSVIQIGSKQLTQKEWESLSLADVVALEEKMEGFFKWWMKYRNSILDKSKKMMETCSGNGNVLKGGYTALLGSGSALTGDKK